MVNNYAGFYQRNFAIGAPSVKCHLSLSESFVKN